MTAKIGLNVVYNPETGPQRPALIEVLKDENGTCDLVVFTAESDGCRRDQDDVPYSDNVVPGTWNNV